MNKIKFPEISVSLIIGYIVAYSGPLAFHLLRSLTDWFPTYWRFIALNSELLGLIIALSGIGLSVRKQRLVYPIVFTISYAVITILLIPIATGPMCLHHDPEFDLSVFLFGGYGGMFFFTLIVVYSWIWWYYSSDAQLVKVTNVTV